MDFPPPGSIPVEKTSDVMTSNCDLTPDAQVQRELKTQLDRFFDEYAEPQWDIYRGGGSKMRRFTRPETK